MADYESRLNDILDAIQGIREAVKDASFEEYQGSRTLRWMSERGIQIISEATLHIPEEIKDQHPDLPWPAIKSIGNKLRHEYHRVSDRIV